MKPISSADRPGNPSDRLARASVERGRLPVAISRPEPGERYATAYIKNSLILVGDDPTAALAQPGVMNGEVRAHVYPLVPEHFASQVSIPIAERTWRVILSPASPASPAVDAVDWAASIADATQCQVDLDHLVSLAPYYVGHPHVPGVPYWLAHHEQPDPDTPYDFTSHYAQFGAAGRFPVAWVGGDPATCAKVSDRRPNVAVVDTGLGEHPWFAEPKLAQTDISYQGYRLGFHGDLPGTERHLAPPHPETGHPWLQSSHGTFIAGLIRQTCPSAHIVVVPVLADDGVVAESALLVTLAALLYRHREAQLRDDPSEVMDVLNLSLGYYHETPDLSIDGNVWRQLLAEFGRSGVSVVVSAGNAATTRPTFPAAFSLFTTEDEMVPQVTVGALSTNSNSGAYYTNSGPWVNCQRVGTAVISTVPIDLETAQPGSPGDSRPGSVDNDGYASGFASWSGTSFAAPIAAGQVAAAIAKDQPSDISPGAMVARGRRAVAQVLESELDDQRGALVG